MSAGLFAGVSHVGAHGPDYYEDKGLEVFTDLAIPLLDFQERDVRKALAFPGSRCLLASDMGVGKSCQMASITAACIEAGIRPVLWVVPPTLTTNTQRELDKFTPWLSVQQPTTRTPYCLADTDVIVIGDSVVADWESALITHGVAALCVDECHREKSHRARRTSAVKAIARTVKGPVICASGTPLPNSPGELTAILEILSVIGRFGGVAQFKDDYTPKLPGNRWGARGIAWDRLDELHERLLAECMVRTRKVDVLEGLPDKGRLVMALDMAESTKADYQLAETRLREFLRTRRGYSRERLDRVDRAEAIVQMGVLRELAGLAVVASATEYITSLTSSRLDGEPPEKVVAFTQHRSVLAALREAIPGAVVIQGGMSAKQKMEAVDKFQTDDDCLVLLGQAVAAGVGLNLTAARHSVHVQLGFNAASLTQCEDRCWRIGADERGVVSHIVFPDLDGAETIQERMYRLINAKHGVSSQVIDGIHADLMDESVEDALIDFYSTF
tara:strand:- start:112 stop:1614 length:1503 start_codon:yes stop_codon:yes gene_type:complete